MKTHTLVFRTVDRDGFDAIRDGLKTVETRAATKRYRGIQVDDQLLIKCGNDSFTKTIHKVQHFAGIDELLAAVPIKDVMPYVKTRADVEREYHSYPGYQAKIAAHGLVAFFL